MQSPPKLGSQQKSTRGIASLRSNDKSPLTSNEQQFIGVLNSMFDV